MTENTVQRHFNWSFPPDEFSLSGEEVHVWAADLEQQETHFKELAKTLSSDEQSRAARFQFRQDRRNFITARGLLRRILSHYTNSSAGKLEFSYGVNGKPNLVALGEPTLQFNVSHSGGLALYAISQDRQLGIDVEKVSLSADMDDVAAQVFLPEEQSALQFLAPQQKAENFFRYWTRKEAQLKCSGEGFSSDLKNQNPFMGMLLELEPAEGFMGALAVAGKSFQLRTWQYSIHASLCFPNFPSI